MQRRHLLPLLLPILALPALAKPPEGHGHGKGHNKHEDRDERQEGANVSVRGDAGGLVSVDISVGDVRVWVRESGVRERYADLPPGIRKNLARGKPLPPGIAKRLPPPALHQRLPQYPGYEWQVVGKDLVLVAATTLVVAAVLNAVFD
ncbi:MAG TPA: anti-virulence regulator CigR family protein [Burkholderiaceae bacterium]|nr:anti-virulence regulator CigR family protein [Burkholderiaceae bacterium]